MVNFIGNFLKNDDILSFWNYLFNFLFSGPVGVFMSMCFVAFIVYLIRRCLFE